MNVKAGDLAIVFNPDSRNDGRIVEVITFLGDDPIFRGFIWNRGAGPCWLVRSTRPLLASGEYVESLDVIEGACPDAWLRPVTGLPDHQATNIEQPTKEAA